MSFRRNRYYVSVDNRVPALSDSALSKWHRVSPSLCSLALRASGGGNSLRRHANENEINPVERLLVRTLQIEQYSEDISSRVVNLNITPIAHEPIASAHVSHQDRDEEYLKMERARYLVCQELFQTEQRYYDTLQTLDTVYFEALRNVVDASTLKVIKGETSADIVLQQLKSKMSDWNSESTIGDVFVPILHYFKLHSQFCNNYNLSVRMIRSIRDQPSVKQVLLDCEEDPRCHRLDITSLLVTGVQRIPRYILLLQNILVNTHPSHKDYPLLETALNGLKAIMAEINKKSSSSMNMLKLLELTDVLEVDSDGPDHELIQPSRRYVREDEACVALYHGIAGLSVGDIVRMFTFSDTLIVGIRKSRRFRGNSGTVDKMNGGVRQDQYKEVVRFDLHALTAVATSTAIGLEVTISRSRDDMGIPSSTSMLSISTMQMQTQSSVVPCPLPPMSPSRTKRSGSAGLKRSASGDDAVFHGPVCICVCFKDQAQSDGQAWYNSLIDLRNVLDKNRSSLKADV